MTAVVARPEGAMTHQQLPEDHRLVLHVPCHAVDLAEGGGGEVRAEGEAAARVPADVVALLDQGLVVKAGERALAEVPGHADREALGARASPFVDRRHLVVAAGVDHERKGELPAAGVDLLLRERAAARLDRDRHGVARDGARQGADRLHLVEQPGLLGPVQLEGRRTGGGFRRRDGRREGRGGGDQSCSYPCPTNHDRGIVQHRAAARTIVSDEFALYATSFLRSARTGMVKSSALTTVSQAALPTIDQSSGPVASPRVISTRW